MKNKIFKILLVLFVVISIIFTVISCSKKDEVKVTLTSNGETIDEGSYADEYVTLSFVSKSQIKKIIIVDKKTNEKKEYIPELINGKYVVKVKVEETTTLEYYTVDEKGKESEIQKVNIKIDKEKPSFDMNEDKEIYTLNSYNEKKDLIIKLTNIKDDSEYKLYYNTSGNYKEINAKDNYDLKLSLNSGIHNIKVKIVDESGKETIKTKIVEINYLININDNNKVKQFKVINGERISYYENLPINNNKLFKGYSVDNENIIDNNYIVNNLKELVALYDEETEVPKEEPKPQKPVNPSKPSTKVNKPTCNNSTYSGNEINLVNGNGNYTIENNKQTIPGTYTITASLIEGYTWNDDSTESITLNCELKKNEITVTSESKSRTYNGEELTASAIVTKGNIYNNKIVYDSTSSIINVGTTTNKGTVKILNKNNDDVTNYFIINQVDGILEVTKNYISVTTGSSSKIYDNTPLTNSVITLTKGTLGKNHTLSFDSQATITNPGTVENTGVIKVLDKNSNDVTNNYSLNTTYGKLTVTGEYTVTYSYNKDNYSDVSISVTTKNIYHGEDAITNAPTASKKGWTFVGWNTDKNATSKLTESIVTSNTTLYAIFTRNLSPQYILINDNGLLQGASLSQPNQSFKENEVKTFTILDRNMTEANLNNLLTQFDVSDYNGFSYYGFTEKPDLSMDKVYFKGDEITVNDVINLYELRRKQVTVTYNTDGGSAVASSTGYAYMDINKNVKNYEISSLPTPTKENYIFDGWYKEDTFVNKVESISTIEDMTLYAKWKWSYPTKYYQTLDAALLDASSSVMTNGTDNSSEANAKIVKSEDDTLSVMLLKDQNRDDCIYLGSTTGYVFDLNGHDINLVDGGVLYQQSGLKLTFINSVSTGKVIKNQKASITYSFFASDNTELLMENIDFEHYVKGDMYGTGVYSCGKVIINNCNVNMYSDSTVSKKGCTISGISLRGKGEVNNTNVRAESVAIESRAIIVLVPDADSVIINGGTYEAFSNDGSALNRLIGVTVNGGTFVAICNSVISGDACGTNIFEDYVKINDGYFYGYHSGASTAGPITINGGVFESPNHGGIYFGNGTAKVKNATLKLGKNEKYEHLNYGSVSQNGTFYIGDTSGDSIVYMDNVTLVNTINTSSAHSGALSSNYSYKDTYLYVSNTNFPTNIRVDGPNSKGYQGHLYIGKNVTYGSITGTGIKDLETYADTEFLHD